MRRVTRSDHWHGCAGPADAAGAEVTRGGFGCARVNRTARQGQPGGARHRRAEGHRFAHRRAHTVRARQSDLGSRPRRRDAAAGRAAAGPEAFCRSRGRAHSVHAPFESNRFVIGCPAAHAGAFGRDEADARGRCLGAAVSAEATLGRRAATAAVRRFSPLAAAGSDTPGRLLLPSAVVGAPPARNGGAAGRPVASRSGAPCGFRRGANPTHGLRRGRGVRAGTQRHLLLGQAFAAAGPARGRAAVGGDDEAEGQRHCDRPEFPHTFALSTGASAPPATVMAKSVEESRQWPRKRSESSGQRTEGRSGAPCSERTERPPPGGEGLTSVTEAARVQASGKEESVPARSFRCRLARPKSDCARP